MNYDYSEEDMMGQVVLTPRKRAAQVVQQHPTETVDELFARVCERLDAGIGNMAEIQLATPVFSTGEHVNGATIGRAWVWSVPAETPSWAARILEDQIVRGVSNPAVVMETTEPELPEPRGRRATGVFVWLSWSLFAALCIVVPFLLYFAGKLG